MLKILYIADLDISKGGGQRRAYEVIRRIAKFNDVYVVSYGVPSIPNGLFEDASLYATLPRFDRLSIADMVSFLSTFNSYLKTIRNSIKDLRPDIVVITGEWMYPVNLALYIHKNWNLKTHIAFIVHEVPAIYTISWNQSISEKIIERIKYGEPLTLFAAPLLFQVSVKTLKKYNVLHVGFGAKYYMERVGITNGIVIHPPNGIDEDYIRKASAHINKEHIPTLVFMAARLTREKGIYDFIKVFETLRHRIKTIKAYIMGRLEKSYHDLLNKIKKIPQLKYLGFVDEKTKYRILARSWLMIYPSKQEAFSISVLEALACGTPVIAYNIPGIALNYKQCDAVITIEPRAKESMAEKVYHLVIDNARLENLWRKATECSMKYRWEQVVKAEYNAYLKILGCQ
mgnify:CR=1 FL=1